MGLDFKSILSQAGGATPAPAATPAPTPAATPAPAPSPFFAQAAAAALPPAATLDPAAIAAELQKRDQGVNPPEGAAALTSEKPAEKPEPEAKPAGKKRRGRPPKGDSSAPAEPAPAPPEATGDAQSYMTEIESVAKIGDGAVLVSFKAPMGVFPVGRAVKISIE